LYFSGIFSGLLLVFFWSFPGLFSGCSKHRLD
jgi:hypothetical protein